MFKERNTYDIKLSSEFTSAAHQLLKTLDISKSTTDKHTHVSTVYRHSLQLYSQLYFTQYVIQQCTRTAGVKYRQ
jgi:hypothetical protein